MLKLLKIELGWLKILGLDFMLLVSSVVLT